MINNRQNGRRRGRGGGGQRNQGGGQGQRDSGNRIDSRARGNAAQLLEKYKNMARDAQLSGDRVNTEYYLQFADHYFRVLADQRGRYEEQGQQVRRGRDDFDGDDDFGDDGEMIRGDEHYRPQDDNRQDRERQNQDHQDRDRQERSSRDRQDRIDRDRQDRPERDRAERSDQRAGREDGNRRFDRQPRDFDRDRQSAPVVERPRETAAANDLENGGVESRGAEGQSGEPRRRGRPRKVQAVETEGEPAFDANVLPPSLGVIASEGEPIDEPKPRRRRRVNGADVSAS